MNLEIDDPLKPFASILEPDERQVAFGESLRGLHHRLSTYSLHTNVPLDVRQMFETAKNVRLYGFFAYRFHQVAETLAYQTLERALRERWNSEVGHLPSIDDPNYRWPMLSELLRQAGSKGWIRNSGFSGRIRRADNAIRQERSAAAISEMQRSGKTEVEIAEPTPEEIEARAETVDVVGLMEQHIPTFRNQLAHGSVRLSPTSDYILQDVCDAINMVFDGTPSISIVSTSSVSAPKLHGLFRNHLEYLEQKRRALLSMVPVTSTTLPPAMPARGVYLFSESKRHMYVGRSNTIRKRIGVHYRLKASHDTASFAYMLAAKKCNIGPATYRKGQGCKEIVKRNDVATAFLAAKQRVRQMDVRFVEETDPIRQALLEIYVAVVYATPYNSFDNH